jgi:hypothetical protein
MGATGEIHRFKEIHFILYFQVRYDVYGPAMDLLRITEPSKNPSKEEDLQDPLSVKHRSGSVKPTVAERPSENDVFFEPEEAFSDSFTEVQFTGTSVLSNSSATTILPSYFNDVIVGRITCNNSANGTEYTSVLDCYNDTYVGGMLNNVSGNGSVTGGPGVEEPLTDVILMGVTSVILGLMILITVIGEYCRGSVVQQLHRQF